MALKVDTKHPEYLEYYDKWFRTTVAYDGEDSVKGTGEANLPRLTDQTDDEYLAYKMRANYPSFLSRIIDTFIGLTMNVQPVVNMPSGMDEWETDLGGKNVSLEDLIKRSLRHNFRQGRLGMLVGRKDEADHAHIAIYDAESIINWGDNWFVLEETYLEQDEDDPFILKNATRWRVIKLGDVKFEDNSEATGIYHQEIYIKDGDEIKLSEVIVPRNSRGEALDYIPFVTVGVDGIDNEITKPPLIDFVNMSMSYYRNSADLEHGLHFTAMPFYYVSGVGGGAAMKNAQSSSKKKSDITLGSQRALRLSDPQAKVGVVEFNGTGLKSIELTMQRKERQMGELGSRILVDETKGVKSADTKRIEGKADTSMAQNIILSVERGMEQSLRFLADFEGFASENIELEINKVLVADSVSTEEVKTALAAVLAGKMSMDTFLKIVQRASFAPKDFDPEEEVKAIDAEIDENVEDEMGDLEPENDED